MSETRCMGCMRIKHNSPVCEHCGYDERQLNDPNQLSAGTVLQNQYIVGRVLGQGGFGITYMGWDLFLDIPVAIKEYFPNTVVTRNITASTQVFLRNEQSRDLFVRNRDRFVREARSLAKLGAEGQVPNIVRVQNLVQANNTAYIIMEFVRGRDLRKFMEQKGRPLTLQETMQFLIPVMESLEKVHENNIIHRDLSPDNIMVLPDGGIKLIDFGAAHEVRRDEMGYQQSTTSIVKHGFAPPEQYTRRGNLGPWTDVYAMSATVYYCLTGHVPPSVQDRQFDGEEISWEGISPALRQILVRGLSLNLSERIQTMTELRTGLTTAATQPKREYPIQTVPLEEQQLVADDLQNNTSPRIPVTVPVQNAHAVSETMPLDTSEREEEMPSSEDTVKNGSWADANSIVLLVVTLIAAAGILVSLAYDSPAGIYFAMVIVGASIFFKFCSRFWE